MSRYYEYMPSKNYAKVLEENVVKRSGVIHILNDYKLTKLNFVRLKQVLRAVVACLVSIFLIFQIFPIFPIFPTFSLLSFDFIKINKAYAEEQALNSGIVATNSITDTENLLGDSVNKVSDEIAATKKRTGVTVRLLYLSTFGDTKDPSKWASDLLISTLPAKNTVLLAVATRDGRLVVAVSPNSDEWLKSRNTVDALSDAAYKPLVTTTGTHWGQSAIMMMKQISRSKSTATTSSASLISTLIMLIIILCLGAIVTLILLHRNRVQKQIKAGARKARRRHARHR